MNTAEAQEYVCPKHPHITLWGVLKGGAGFCRSCGLYTQAKDVPMPTLPPKPEKVKTMRARKAKATPTKVKRTRKVAAKLTATNVVEAS